ncbi:MAG: fasciclin domain-containing protein [Carbonactinosporaceae bacterium]
MVAAALSAGLLFAGCAGEGGEAATDGGGDEAGGQKPVQAAKDESQGPMADLVGPGCKAYAKQVPSGAGSVQGMAESPVAVAASNNPLLTTLTKSVSGKLNTKVNLVDTLNGGEFTVFAPVDDAFAQLPASTVKQLSQPKNADTLTSILTYHVVEGQLAPDEITSAQASVQGEKVKVSGSGNSLKVNDTNVICGGVQTANATVYLIDGVLTPPSMM